MNIKEFLVENKIGDIKEHEELKKHTTYKVGGQCDYFVQPASVEKLVLLLKYIKENNINYKVLGNGSNVLISSKRFKGIIISLNKLNQIKFDNDIVEVGAGVLLIKLSNACANENLGGLEFASGIPGCVGGAIFMNAGAYGGEMKDIVTSVDLLKNGEEITVSSGDMNFSYRHSIAMDEDMIVLRMRIKLVRKDKSEILSLMDDLNGRRRDKQPLEYPSAGSTFKRPEGYFAGKLIMDSGLSGERVGGAMVSTKHCGFIINYDNATATEIYELIKKVQSIVYEKQGVMLEPEVRLIGDFE